MYTLPWTKKIRVISALAEGVSIRAAARLCEVDRETVMYLGVSVGEACQRLHDRLLRNLQVNILELDEIWSYVGKKQGHLQPSDPPELGDQYTYVGLDAIRRAIVAFRVGKREAATTDAFALDLRERILNRPQITSDGFQPYVDAIVRAFGTEVDYAMLIKGAGGHRKTPIIGHPDPARISTSYVERQNLTMRQHLQRFVRRTTAFSRKLRNHAAAVALHVGYYNFCHIHESLRMTPAMALGLTRHPWSVAELVEAACSMPPTEPAKPRIGAGPVQLLLPAIPATVLPAR